MSTWLYLRCEDHDPPLESDDESGQHLYDLPRVRQEIKDRDFLINELIYGNLWHFSSTQPVDLYFRKNSAKFLKNHPFCNIGIVDEYGRTYPIESEEE